MRVIPTISLTDSGEIVQMKQDIAKRYENECACKRAMDAAKGTETYPSLRLTYINARRATTRAIKRLKDFAGAVAAAREAIPSAHAKLPVSSCDVHEVKFAIKRDNPLIAKHRDWVNMELETKQLADKNRALLHIIDLEYRAEQGDKFAARRLAEIRTRSEKK